MNGIRNQLDEYFSHVDEAQGSVDVFDVVESVTPLDVESVPRPVQGRGGWLVAAAAAVFVLVLLGGLSLLAQLNDRPADSPVVDQVDPETPPVIDPLPTTLPPVVEPVEPDEPPADPDAEADTHGLLQNLPPDAEFGTLVTPIGRAEWVHLTGDGTALPVYGEVVEWPSGYAILEPGNPFNGDHSTRLWVSPDGIEWHIEPLPALSNTWGASLTLVDGVYWLILSGPASVWRSTDGLTWEESDLGDVIPGAVGLNWDMHHTPPVTVDDTTLVYAAFGSNFPYAEYAPNLTEDGRTCDHVRLAKQGSDVFQVVEDFGDGPDCPEQPVLRMIEVDTGLQVADNDTGTELGEILGADLTDMARVSDETLVDDLLIINDGDIASVEVPWRPTDIVTLFSAGEAVYAYVDDPTNVWRTNDGRTWTDLGPLSLEKTATTGSVEFTATRDGRLVAQIRDIPNVAWETTDGMNWQTVDLRPLPDGGATQTIPVPLDSGWFANAGWRGSSDDGNRWWIKTANGWLSLEEMGIGSAGRGGVAGPTAIGNTTFFPANSGRDMWILRHDLSE